MNTAHTMQALVCRAFGPPQDVVQMQQIASPGPGLAPSQVRIAVAYANVSHATGLLIEGKYQRRPPLPFVPGTEGVGRVLECGSAVEHLQVGDAVAFIADWGAFAQQVVLRAHTVYRIPGQLPWLKALPIALSYGTAYTALHWRMQLQSGDAVLVLGAGSGVGAAAVEVARQTPGVHVIACASTEDKRNDALRRGAHHAVEPADLAARVKALTGGHGASVVFDPVGGDLLLQALRAAAQNAQILSVGFASGGIPQVPMNLALVKNLTLHGFFYGRYIGWTPADEREAFAARLQAAIATLFGWAVEGRIHPHVSQVFEMHQLADALRALHGRSVTGKLALAIQGDKI
ncbi:Mycocerosic acid synthase [Delftia tsuruhatensis]|nr:Mycocerosic acid synthase [Delftia tsuruhatensis]CAC9675804.1 Mycocerosic acid synthase [Delftia tsuruhatensis]